MFEYFIFCILLPRSFIKFDFAFLGAIQNMGDSDIPSQNNSCFGSDWNSNQFLATDEKKTEQKVLGDSMFEQLSNANKEYLR